MNYYYSYPYGGPMPTPDEAYWRYQSANPMGGYMNSNSVQPPFPSGSSITSQTPTEPGQTPTTPNSGNFGTIGGFEVPVGDILATQAGINSYVSNILRLNRGKLATVYMTFSGNDAATTKRTFVGVIEAAGRDHIVLSDPNTGHRFVLLTVYLDYVEFPSEINYYYPESNILNVADPDLFEKYPTLGVLYNYQKQQYDQYKQKYPYYNQLPENNIQQHQSTNNYMQQTSYGNSEQY